MDAYLTSQIRFLVGGDGWLADLSGFAGSLSAAGDVDNQPLTVLNTTVIENIPFQIGHVVSPGVLYYGDETKKLSARSKGFAAIVSLVPKACAVLPVVHPGLGIAANNETVVIHSTAFTQDGPNVRGAADGNHIRAESFTDGADVGPWAYDGDDEVYAVVTAGSGDFEFNSETVTASGPGIYHLGTVPTAGLLAASVTTPAGSSGYVLAGAVAAIDTN